MTALRRRRSDPTRRGRSPARLVALTGAAAVLLSTAGPLTSSSAGAAPATAAVQGVAAPATARLESGAARVESGAARVESGAAAAPGRATRVPTVTGPLPVSPSSYPFGAAARQRVPQDLARDGYVEEEFLVSGRAAVYDWPRPGPAVVRTPDVPYTTRVLVRRPADRARFSGNVVVEMLNPSNLFDLNIGWALMHDQLVHDGDVWVGITAKPTAVVALKAFDPGRYGRLSFANPLALDDPDNCQTPNTLIAGDSSRATENGLVWDMHSQVAAWLHSRHASNPLTYGTRPGTRKPVQHLYGFGYSQTGGYLYTYINAIAPLARRASGAPLFDGYVVAVAGGAFAGTVPIHQCAPSIPVTDPRNQIRDAGVPVMHIMSESDYLLGIASRRPDSDEPGDRFRHYEVPGMGHATPEELYFSAAPEDIVRAGRTIPSFTCDEGPRSRFPSSLVFDAALRNLDRWVRYDVPPPRTSRIKVVDGQGVTDRFGNLVGGYRTPLLEAPTATWSGSSAGGGFCFIAGHEEPFSDRRLRRLYGDHQGYVQAVITQSRALQEARLLTGRDANWLIRTARSSDVLTDRRTTG